MKAPVLVGPVKKFEMGMPLDKAKAAKPELFQKGGFRAGDWGGDKGIQFEGFADPTGSYLQTIRISFAKEHKDLEDTLLRVWGEPQTAKLWASRAQTAEGKVADVEAKFWFNEDKDLRAVYFPDPQRGGKRTLQYTYFMPLKKLWGSKKGRPAWMAQKILGSTKAELEAAYPGFETVNDKRANLHLPATEWVEFHTVVMVDFDDDGKAKRWEIRHQFAPKPEAEKQLYEVLEAIFGKAEKLDVDIKPWEEKHELWTFGRPEPPLLPTVEEVKAAEEARKAAEAEKADGEEADAKPEEPKPKPPPEPILEVTLQDWGTLSSLVAKMVPPPEPVCPEGKKCPPPPEPEGGAED